MYDSKTFKNQLEILKDEKYREFTKKLGIGKLEPIGIRLPQLKSLAKELANSNWQEFFMCEKNWCSEIITLKGLVIGYAKIDFEIFTKYLNQFFDMVESWIETDTSAPSFKIIKKNKQQIFDLINPYLFCNQEYKTRLALIILLDYYLTDDYIDKVLEILPNIQQGQYYVDMALAWILSVCFVKYRDKTIQLFECKRFSKFVQNKAIQKCRESFRISQQDKELLKQYKL